MTRTLRAGGGKRLALALALATTMALAAAACTADDDAGSGTTPADAASGAQDATVRESGTSPPRDAALADASAGDAGDLDATAIDADADAGPDASVPAHFSPTSITCIGDSITYGVGASAATKDWVSDLGVLLDGGVPIGNFGVSGATMLKVSDLSYWSTGELPLAEAYAGKVDAGAVSTAARSAVIIMLGTNDSKAGNWVTVADASAPDRYRADYEAMIDAVLATNPAPLVFLAYPPPAFSTAVQPTVISGVIVPIIASIAHERGLPIVDVQKALAGMSQDFVDGVHPDDVGHAIVAQTMHDALLSPHVPTLADGG